jgi:hypothetical protein
MEKNTETNNLNTQENKDSLIQHFPKLANDQNFKICSPETSNYNCIAWAMQFTDRFVTYEKGPQCWWPPNAVERNVSSSALIAAFKAVGFTECNNKNLEKGFDKVVLYKLETKDEWTHASRIIDNSVEHSKFGHSFDGTHSHDKFQGTDYGIPYAIMKRRTNYDSSESKLQIGTASANLELLRQQINNYNKKQH